MSERPEPVPSPDYVEGEPVPGLIGEEVRDQRERRSGGSLKKWGKAYAKGSIIGVAMQTRKSLASFACLLLGVLALASAIPAAAALEPEPQLVWKTQISGIAQVGQTLTATPAVWNRNGVNIKGVVGSWRRCVPGEWFPCKTAAEPYGSLPFGDKYVVTTADVGFTIRAWSSLTLPNTLTVSSGSEPTAVVTAAPTTPPTTPTPTPTPTPTAAATAPSVSAFASTVGVKLSTGAGTLTATCGAPATESCTFSLTLFASVKNGHASSASKVNIGTVTGKLQGGKSGKLTVKLNKTGRKYLKHGTVHPEATGTVKDTAGLVTHFHKRVTIKKK